MAIIMRPLIHPAPDATLYASHVLPIYQAPAPLAIIPLKESCKCLLLAVVIPMDIIIIPQWAHVESAILYAYNALLKVIAHAPNVPQLLASLIQEPPAIVVLAMHTIHLLEYVTYATYYAHHA